MPEAETELVLSVALPPGPHWLVSSVPEAVAAVVEAGGTTLLEPENIPVGRLAVVADPFGNSLALLDLSKGRYVTNSQREVTGVETISDGRSTR